MRVRREALIAVVAFGLAAFVMLPVASRVADQLDGPTEVELVSVVLDNTADYPPHQPVIKVPSYDEPWHVEFWDVGFAQARFQSFPVGEPHMLTIMLDCPNGGRIEAEFRIIHGNASITNEHPIASQNQRRLQTVKQRF